MERHPELRASDADREQVAERLRSAMAEGRLGAEELEQRLEALFASRTYGELEELVRDLPDPPEPSPARSRVPVRVGGVAGVTLMLAVLGALTGGRGHSYSAAPGSGAPAGHIHVFGAPAFMTAAVAMLVAVAMGLALCAVAGWLYTRGPRTSDA